MATKVSDMTPEELQELINNTIGERFENLLATLAMVMLEMSSSNEAMQDAADALLEAVGHDPDEGLELRPEFVEELRARIARYETGERAGLSVDDVRRELGLES